MKTPFVVHFNNTVEGRWRALEEEDKDIKASSKYLSWPLGRFSDKLAVKVGAACVFVSEATRDDALKYYSADPKRCFVLESGVENVVYVSCNPVNLAEDLKILKDKYSIEKLIPVDMFPHTRHVEVIAILKRDKV